MPRPHRRHGDTRTAEQRGYGKAHKQLRAQWAPHVAAGRVGCHAITCLMPSRLIIPGSRWDLGHTTDRTAWTGPEHMRCSRADGARRRNKPPIILRRAWSL